jgi:hypothetical protein
MRNHEPVGLKSAMEIKHEQFLLTSDGPLPVAAWRTPIQ